MILNLVLAMGFIGWARWWDVRERRVPNGVWIVGLVPLLALHVYDPWAPLAYLGAVPMILGLVGLRIAGWWGMGDVKGCAWLLGIMGPPAFLVMLLIAVAVGGTGDSPFFKHLFIGVLATGIPWLLFMLIPL